MMSSSGGPTSTPNSTLHLRLTRRGQPFWRVCRAKLYALLLKFPGAPATIPMWYAIAYEQRRVPDGVPPLPRPGASSRDYPAAQLVACVASLTQNRQSSSSSSAVRDRAAGMKDQRAVIGRHDGEG
jgi:hypothetical protein